MDLVSVKTRARIGEWAANPDVLGVLLVGSRSRGHSDELSDDDLEVVLTDQAAARLNPTECSDTLIEGAGAGRRLIYDAEYLGIGALKAKETSYLDLDHWPYERSPILFDRTGELAELVPRLGAMSADFRAKRLLHATIDAWIPPYRVGKCLKRGQVASAHLLVARGARALARLLFALEWRWVPLDHWLQPELATLEDPAWAAPLLVHALETCEARPLQDALAALEEALRAESVPDAKERGDLFLELIHPSRAEERAIHGLQ